MMSRNTTTTTTTTAPTWRDAAPLVVDWCVLACVCLVSLAFVLFSIYIVRVRHTKYGQTVNFCNVPILVATMAASVVHMFATLVANGHFRALDFDCAFWTLWGQFVAGLGLRLVFITVRTVTYAFILSRALKQNTHLRRRVWTTLISSTMLVPPLILALLATIGAHTPLADDYILWRDETGWCVLSWESKLVLVVWILGCFGANLALAISIRQHHSHTTANVREIFKPVRDTLVLGLVIMACELALVLGDFVREWWGRTLFELMIIALHVFTIARAAAVPAWKCFRRDRLYLLHYQNMLCPRTARVVCFDELRSDRHALDTFMWWCVEESAQRAWLHYDERHATTLLVWPKNAYWCWSSIVRRRELDSPTDLATERTTHAVDILKFYVGSGCEWPVVVPPQMALAAFECDDKAAASLFAPLEEYILTAFMIKYWNVYQRTCSIEVVANLMHIQYFLSSSGMLDARALVEPSSDDDDDDDDVARGASTSVFASRATSRPARRDTFKRITVERHQFADPRRHRMRVGNDEMNAAARFEDEMACARAAKVRGGDGDGDDDFLSDPDDVSRHQSVELFRNALFGDTTSPSIRARASTFSQKMLTFAPVVRRGDDDGGGDVSEQDQDDFSSAGASDDDVHGGAFDDDDCASADTDPLSALVGRSLHDAAAAADKEFVEVVVRVPTHTVHGTFV